MHVFVTGGTGHSGSYIVPVLVEAAHEVIGLARSDAPAAALRANGANVRRGWRRFAGAKSDARTPFEDLSSGCLKPEVEERVRLGEGGEPFVAFSELTDEMALHAT